MNNKLPSSGRPKCPVKTSFSKMCLLGVLVPLLLATHASGALIIWNTPTNVNIDDPTQVLTNGTFFAAGSVFSEFWTSAPNTVNGVVFGNLESSHFSIPYSGGTFAFPVGPSGQTPYGNVIGGELDVNNTTSATTPCVLSGLTSGVTYQFQI